MKIPQSVYAHTMLFTTKDAEKFERRLAPYGDSPPADVAMREAKRQEMIVVARNCALRRMAEPRQTVRPRVFCRPRERQAVGGRRTRGRSPDDPDPSGPAPPRPLVAAVGRVEDSGTVVQRILAYAYAQQPNRRECFEVAAILELRGELNGGAA